ncbi:hypothetical protein [uncultured Nonlabens sp.]|uniref:hypothetical protein n=1 Tax=uncultured Nonlabens sp. TaxID=859306 RepID=UPI00262CAFA5|nr:hypothetical protein [uncultured Nonlabens sp.]
MELDVKYTNQINSFISDLQKQIHRELFEEEYDEQYDSSSEAYSRKNGTNPMNEEYIQKVKEKREKQGVPMLAANGLPKDNSTEILVRKKIIEVLLNKLNTQPLTPKPKMNISSFFKTQK